MRVILLLVLLKVTCGLAQSLSHDRYWYFGLDGAGLLFGDGPPTILLDNANWNTYASGSHADPDGNLMLYASRQQIRNSQHQVVQNGSGFAYAEAAPGPLAVPFPGHPGEFFVLGWRTEFSPAVRRMYYQHVDMNANGGTGAVVAKDVVLRDSVGNGVVAIPHCNGSDFWVVLHERHTDRYLSYQLSSGGWSSNPVVSAVGPPHFHWLQDYDFLQASPAGNRLAHTYRTADWSLDLYDFDPCTGLVHARKPIAQGAAFTRMPEFSPSGEVLYVVTNPCQQGDSSRLWQYDLSSGDTALIQASAFQVHATAWEPNCQRQLGGCALAPDGKIYVGLTGDTCLAVIEEPDLLGAACTFTWCGQSLGGRTGSHALPHRYKGALSSVGMMDRGSRTMQVYPTPASDGVWITGGRPARVVAFDLRGAVAAHWELNGDRSWIPRNGLAAGAYVLRLENRAGGVIGFARALFE